ncbi:hypothetical protein, variant 1 [Exophiala oligosperma]|nr:hypothetical protein, variant 1 [Exophiala oligosperma]KIW46642.1 hypothetical protein, variant 1 [Exophiala oligosperma]
MATMGTPCSSCSRASLDCHEFHPKRRRIRVAEAALTAASEAHASSTALPSSSYRSSYATLGEGDHDPEQIQVLGSEDIAKAGSILLDFLSQDFDKGSIGDYQATFVEDYANVLRVLGPVFGKGFQPNVKHFRDAPFIKRLNGTIPRTITEEERAILDHHGSFVLPDRNIASGFITAFFDRVYPTMPIIDQAGLRKSYLDLSSLETLCPPLLLLQAVILSGSTVWQHPDLQSQPEEVSRRLHHRAKALVDQRFEQDRLTLVVAHLLFSTYTCDSCDDTIQNMWLSLGSAVRIAQGLGMHRDLGSAATDSKHRRQWKKVWWTLVLHDTLCSFEWGRPRAIHLADSDVPELQQSDFEPTEPGALACAEHIDFFLAAISLCFIINDWLDCLRPGGRAKGSYRLRREQGSQRAQEELQSWLSGLPPTMNPNRPPSQHTLWSGTLHVAYYTAVIRFDSIAGANAQVVHDAATAISKICLSLFEQDLINSIWVFAIHQLYLAMCQHARESRDPDPSISARGLQNLQESLPVLKKLGAKNSVARQAFIFLDEVSKGEILPHPDNWHHSDFSPWNIDSLPWQFPGFDQLPQTPGTCKKGTTSHDLARAKDTEKRLQ